jgi:hypothetical protein
MYVPPPSYSRFLEVINTQFQVIHEFYRTRALLVMAIGYCFFYNLANVVKGLSKIESKTPYVLEQNEVVFSSSHNNRAKMPLQSTYYKKRDRQPVDRGEHF